MKKLSKKYTLGIIVVLVLLGYFVIYPFVVRTFLSNPKNVYEATIKTAFKEISTTVNEVVHEKAIYDMNLSVDSNIDVLKDYSGYTYGINVGVDPNASALQAGLYLKNSTIDYSIYGYIKDGKKYSRYSTDKELNYLGLSSTEETDELFKAFKNLLDYSDKATSEEINYIIDKLSNLIVV